MVYVPTIEGLKMSTTASTAKNYRKLVIAICKNNNLQIIRADRNVIDIEYGDHFQCRANGLHGLYYPDLKDTEQTMGQIWQAVWFDLEPGVRPCPLDCDCYQ